MSETDRYIHGLVKNLENLKGTLSSPANIEGFLSNATLRGIPIELQIDGTMLQWKYLDEDTWIDLIDLNNIDYELLGNLPRIQGVKLIGNKTFEDLGLSALTSAEVEAALT